MKREFINENKSIFVITCDNLKEYFAEFAKYRKVASESNYWDKGFNENYIGQGVWCLHEDHGDNFFGRSDSRIVVFLLEDYNNDFEGRNGILELNLKVDLKSSEWLSQKEKINQTLKEIWETGEIKNPCGLDLNWPKVNQSENGDKKQQEKKQLQTALQKITTDSSPEKA